MIWNRVSPAAFPREGRIAVGSLGVVAGREVEHLVEVVGKPCADCLDAFEAGDLVTLIADIGGTSWVHDAHVRQEAAE